MKKTKHWFDHWHRSEGRVGPTETDLWVWDCEESICSDGELRERETHRPETLCHTDDAGDHFWQPPGAGARDHGFFNSAFTLRYLRHTPDISWLAACFISLNVCHTESKSLLSPTAALLSISRIYRSSGCSFKFMTWRQETFGQVKINLAKYLVFLQRYCLV